MTVAGMAGGTRAGVAALVESGQLQGVCPQERATRTRSAGLNASGLPDEALDLLLQRRGLSRTSVDRYVAVEGDGPVPPGFAHRVDHHRAHATTAYLTSPFGSAVILVCDHEAPEVSVWTGQGRDVNPVSRAWAGTGFVRAFARCASALGFVGPAAGQRMEALARLRPDSYDPLMASLIRREGDALVIDDALEAVAAKGAGAGGSGSPNHAAVAAALQARLAELLVEFVQQLRAELAVPRLCLGGSLFYHSAMNTAVRQSGVFEEVFVPVDPGNSGLAVGAALDAAGSHPVLASPFLGPQYSPEETKQVLDNCKLQYSWKSDEDAVMVAVRALKEGRLVGWFDGAMEWGPRALGARCILANPTAPYVLDNLNRFLKHREPWRGYALSVLQEAVHEHFEGPAEARFMECDYRPRDPERLREALPSREAAVRVHTVAVDAPLPKFRRLLEAFGEATGVPCLINTSFNSHHEPIVCSPRDAVSVFYATGVDLLVMNQFVLSKQ
jgi:carbamoyltransferase